MRRTTIPPKRRKGDGAPHPKNLSEGALSPAAVMTMLDITRSKFNALIKHGDLVTIKVRGVIRVPVRALRKAFPALFP